MHEIDLLERVHRRMLASMERGDGHVRRPELRAHGAGAELGDVGHEFRLEHGEIHGIEATPLADRVRDVVVAVDEWDRLEDAQGLGAVILRGQGVGRTGTQEEREPDRHLPDHAHVTPVGFGERESWRPTAPLSRLRFGTMVDTKVKIALELNGDAVEVAFAPHKTLLEVLREDLGLTGTKHGCELGECGTCTVLLDATPVLSCLVLGLACAGRRVKTVEGMAPAGTLHPLQEARSEEHTSELQSPCNLVCRLLLEKKNTKL